MNRRKRTAIYIAEIAIRITVLILFHYLRAVIFGLVSCKDSPIPFPTCGFSNLDKLFEFPERILTILMRRVTAF